METLTVFGVEYMAFPSESSECSGCDADSDIRVCKRLAVHGCTNIYKIKNRLNLKLLKHDVLWRV